MQTSYLIALGSNMRHVRFGPPAQTLVAAMDALGIKRKARSRIVTSRPIGPSQRTYANAAGILKSSKNPQEMLRKLKKLERKFGRHGGGQRWRARVLDLDIILWSAGIWADKSLAIPHLSFRDRDFVLTPACDVASDWRDPVSGFSIRQLKARLDRRRPLA